jgi:hypothetical protein
MAKFLQSSVLRAISVLGVGALAACNDASSAPGGGGTGAADGAASGVDAAPTDAGAPEDAALGATVERKATVAFAAPDLPPQFACFVGFAPAADGSPQGDPVAARGPWGIPDPTDPNTVPVFGNAVQNLPVKLTGGFPYGAMVALPIRHRDAPFFDELAGVLFTVSEVTSAVFAGDGVDSATCRSAWTAIQGSTVPLFTLKPGTLKVGESILAGISGCTKTSTDPQCAGGNNLASTSLLLDVATPGSFAGTGDTPVGVQVANLAPYAGYQNADLYVQPMKPADAGGASMDGGASPDGGAAAVPDGAPLLVGSAGAGLSWKQITAASTGIRLSSATDNLAQLLVVEHGTTPSCGGASPCTTTTSIPIQPFLATYAKSTGAAWSGNETFVLFGRPPVSAGENPASFLRLGIFPSAI